MDLLKLPTDNLYIFLTLGGLLLLVFSINQLNKLLIERGFKVSKVGRRVAIAEKKSKHLNDIIKGSLKIIEMRTKLFEKKYNVEFFKSDNEKDLIQIPDSLSIEKIDDYIKDFNAIMKLDKQQNSDLHKFDVLITKIGFDTKELKNQKIEVWLRLAFFGLLMLLSSFIITTGFVSWNDKHQTYQDGLIKKEYENAIMRK